MACGPQLVTPGDAVGAFIEQHVVETSELIDRLDPQLDADGDGLLNGDELMFGTDPYDVDSDDDMYRDGDEVFEGTNPLDQDDVIYRGGWPYNSGKQSIEVVSNTPELGTPFARFHLADQYQDKVDLFDMLGDDAYVIVLVFGAWCEDCQDINAYLAGDDASAPPHATELEDLLASGDVRLVQVMTENKMGQPTSQDDVLSWHATYPLAGVPVLCDDRGDLADYAAIEDMLPTAYVLDAQGRIVHMQVDPEDMTALEWVATHL
jgi:thiol-disulfide isomerase/thioredoxin